MTTANDELATPDTDSCLVIFVRHLSHGIPSLVMGFMMMKMMEIHFKFMATRLKAK